MLNCLKNAIYLMDDFKQFKNVQISKYEQNRHGKVSKNTPEYDVIYELIKEYWCDLLATGFINSKTTNEKREIFYSIEIIFPYTKIPSEWTDGINYVDFKSYRL